VENATPPVAPAAGGIFRSLLPERSVEDVFAGVLRVKLGDGQFPIPVLVIEKADVWRASLSEKFSEVVGALEGQTNAAGVLTFLGTHTPTMIELLRDYDLSNVLPDNDWIRKHATEPEILRAFMLVLAANFPFIAAALDILAANPGALTMVLEEFGPVRPTPDGSPTNTSHEPTAGPSKRSGRRSRTNSSTAI